jgi:hypothetical protein
MARFRAPVRRKGAGFVIDVGADERELLRRLLGELRDLLLAGPDADDPRAAELVSRLFPVAHPDDPDAEAEYQRLMRDELVASRLAAIATVDDVLDVKGPVTGEQLTAFMQSVNAVRLVLGTLLGVTDDPDADEVAPGHGDSPEYHLYGYLSWLLEWTVRAQT